MMNMTNEDPAPITRRTRTVLWPPTPPQATAAAPQGAVTPEQAAEMARQAARDDALGLVGRLTGAERTVLELLCKGLMHKEIARHLEISPNTVAELSKRMLKKLECHNAVEAAVLACKAGVA